MDIQRKLDFIETYRNYMELSRRSETGIEFYFLPEKKKNPKLNPATLTEADYDRKKGFRF